MLSSAELDLDLRDPPIDAAPRRPNPLRLASGSSAGSASSSNNITLAAAKAPAARPPVSASTSDRTTTRSPDDSVPQPTSVAARDAMNRNRSIDTVSSLSSVSTSQQRPAAPAAYHVSQEPADGQDVAALLAAAASPEAAVQKLLNEKNQAASHNAQLWRLVEKQRAMILGLNKDLEKALKEKERYRKKIKDHITSSSQSEPLLTSAGGIGAVAEDKTPAISTDAIRPLPPSAANIALDSSPVDSLRPDATRDVSITTPSNGLPIGPKSPNSLAGFRNIDVVRASPQPVDIKIAQPAPAYPLSTSATPPVSPRLPRSPMLPDGGFADLSHNPPIASPVSQAGSSQTVASPKHPSRKAPPAPLQLTSSARTGGSAATSNVIDASDSEYEGDPESARAEQMTRGRRKTREEDDRQREVLAQREAELRSRSAKEKQSKSKGPVEKPPPPPGLPDAKTTEAPAVQPRILALAQEHTAAAPLAQQQVDSAPVDRRVPPSSISSAPKNAPGPTFLLSPGLPMSPRPGDRPMNSPLPRAPNKILNSMPMSPRSGLADLPLTPRAPRQPIPMPPQTPLSFASPHLARAETYQVTQPAAFAAQSAEQEKATSVNDPAAVSGNVYRGFMSEQHPGLLLPPNALPSVYVKTASSRMKPSRQSYIAPRADENPVFTLAVHQRSDNRQLWRVEKTFASLYALDQAVKSVSNFRDRIPDRVLFTGHAPAKIDARRLALDAYVGRMLDAAVDDRSAIVICKFFSTDAIEAIDAADATTNDQRADTPTKQRGYREGYLTKRGKNFGGWKARYFVLDGPNLKYFDDRGGAQLGVIKLQNAQIGKQSSQDQNTQEDEDNQFRHAFLILEPKKKDSTSLVRHVLCAENDQERDLWVDALLQYVDFRDDETDGHARGGGVQLLKTTDWSAARSPRMQMSFGDLRHPSGKDSGDALKSVGYEDTVAGEAPTMGNTPVRKGDTPSPTVDGKPAGSFESSAHPTISGPTNLQPIPNDWGKKSPPAQQGNAKKRGLLATLRGRSSSDLNDKSAAADVPPPTASMPAAFGISLAEAAEFARPLDVATDLPAVAYRCIEYLTAHDAITEEGIFRLSGSNTVIRGLRERFNTEGDVNLLAEGTYYDIHAVASLLKLYLRELPASILTRDLHLEFLQCLDLQGAERIAALNGLVHKLPKANFALLQALSAFLRSIVDNSEVNKMNVRNVGIVFHPTLNVPAPLISAFVEEEDAIFGAPAAAAVDSPMSAQEISAAPTQSSTDLRSPRKQMFSDLPTPAYNQTTFQSLGGASNENTGMIPMHPAFPQHSSFRVAPQGDGAYGSLNDALRMPTVYNTVANGVPSTRDRDAKTRRRESAVLGGGATGAYDPASSPGS